MSPVAFFFSAEIVLYLQNWVLRRLLQSISFVQIMPTLTSFLHNRNRLSHPVLEWVASPRQPHLTEKTTGFHSFLPLMSRTWKRNLGKQITLTLGWDENRLGVRRVSRAKTCEKGKKRSLSSLTSPFRCRAANFPFSLPNSCHEGYAATKMWHQVWKLDQNSPRIHATNYAVSEHATHINGRAIPIHASKKQGIRLFWGITQINTTSQN